MRSSILTIVISLLISNMAFAAGAASGDEAGGEAFIINPEYNQGLVDSGYSTVGFGGEDLNLGDSDFNDIFTLVGPDGISTVPVEEPTAEPTEEPVVEPVADVKAAKKAEKRILRKLKRKVKRLSRRLSRQERRSIRKDFRRFRKGERKNDTFVVNFDEGLLQFALSTSIESVDILINKFCADNEDLTICVLEGLSSDEFEEVKLQTEASTDVVSATNGAIMSMARGIKG